MFPIAILEGDLAVSDAVDFEPAAAAAPHSPDSSQQLLRHRSGSLTCASRDALTFRILQSCCVRRSAIEPLTTFANRS